MSDTARYETAPAFHILTAEEYRRLAREQAARRYDRSHGRPYRRGAAQYQSPGFQGGDGAARGFLLPPVAQYARPPDAGSRYLKSLLGSPNSAAQTSGDGLPPWLRQLARLSPVGRALVGLLDLFDLFEQTGMQAPGYDILFDCGKAENSTQYGLSPGCFVDAVYSHTPIQEPPNARPVHFHTTEYKGKHDGFGRELRSMAKQYQRSGWPNLPDPEPDGVIALPRIQPAPHYPEFPPLEPTDPFPQVDPMPFEKAPADDPFPPVLPYRDLPLRSPNPSRVEPERWRVDYAAPGTAIPRRRRYRTPGGFTIFTPEPDPFQDPTAEPGPTVISDPLPPLGPGGPGPGVISPGSPRDPGRGDRRGGRGGSGNRIPRDLLRFARQPVKPEKKVRAKVAGVMKVIGPFTEVLDLVNALFESLPPEIKDMYGTRRDTRYGVKVEPYWISRQNRRIEALWRHGDKIDLATALEKIFENDRQDRLLGKVSGAAGKAAVPFFPRSPFGLTVGPAL